MITLASLTKAWERSQEGGFGACGTFARLGQCSDTWCPQDHIKPSYPPTMKDVRAARKRERERRMALEKFTSRRPLPSEPEKDSDYWVRCTFCGCWDSWYDRAQHKCDVLKRLPYNVIRNVSHDLIYLPGYYMAKRHGCPAQVVQITRPYLLKHKDIRDYETRMPVKVLRGTGDPARWYANLRNGWGHQTLFTEAQFKADFEKLPDNVRPNGWGGIRKVRK